MIQNLSDIDTTIPLVKQPFSEKSSVNNDINSTLVLQLNSNDDIPSSINLREWVNQNLKPSSEFSDFNEFQRYRRMEYKNKLREILSEHVIEFNQFKFANSVIELATNNPTKLTNAYWQTVARYNIDAYEIATVFKLDIAYNSTRESRWKFPPLWSMQRIGQTTTELPDGRQVLIGGEYEDYYDPQFCIYNDVIVKYPDGKIDIYGYPKHIFPPTDFHTATLVDDEIWIIGSLGYPDDRQYSHTQVYKLNIHDYEINQVPTRNSMGWVNDHTAEYKDGQVIVTGGRMLMDEHSPLQEQIDTWALNLNTLIWQNVTNRQWKKFIVQRKDLDWLHLDEYKSLQFYANDLTSDCYQQHFTELKEKIGIEPYVAIYEQLLIPPVEHILDDSENLEHNERAIFVDDIRIRYVIEMEHVQVYVEGTLLDKKLQLLQENLRHKLEKIENSPCEIKEL